MEFKNWKDVLASVLKDRPGEHWYLIRVEDTRTRFMNHADCIRFIQGEIVASPRP
jgi:hypothetical protein